ncbi:hypothetical protein IQ249_03070 [Lusitaniella coriacea LEGE 07157]|uniref:Uncharacterized protein n=1 Tax=Lusitaniella coriacea LEGE 07157 TaxID=945747 RepID=A0A8J7B728_9CYAN|nr:hypothetical protein [Lusitaniella coriacea]MBE9114871.1 hypothetical protein [Lusitaniella coriacea LEGE 07157]
MKFFKSFWLWLLGGLFWDSPLLPWSLGTFNKETLFEDVHTHPLAKLLEYGQQELFQRFYCVVLTTARRVRREEEELADLLSKQEEFAAQVASLEGEVANRPKATPDSETYEILTQIPPKPTIPKWEVFLTVGLSSMLLLGIVEFLGFNLQSLTLDKLPLLMLGLAFAICINLAEYKGIVGLVKGVRRYDPKRSFHNDPRYAETVPFWSRIQSGDAAIWTSIAIVVMETCFAAPGLINLLHPDEKKKFLFQLTVFAAAGLAALVNIILAWGNALAEIQWEQTMEEYKLELKRELEARQQNPEYREQYERNWQQQQEIRKQTQELYSKLGAAKAHLQEVTKQVAKKEQDVSTMREQARREYERWEIAVRRWMQSHPDIVERFIEYYPQWQEEDDESSNNGYRRLKPVKQSNNVVNPN